ncbi:MAG: helix-hairpin-helix domain-containing protein [Actinomycetes bacterium]
MHPLPRPVLISAGVVAVIAVAFAGRSLAGGSSATSTPASSYTGHTYTPTPAAAGIVQRSDQRPVVHVAGAVRHPGVYRLGPNARVRDAVLRAGGATNDGDANGINLAAKLSDGQQVIVPLKAGSVAAGAAVPAGSAPGSNAPVSLGSATVDQLDALDGVGPATAQKIIQWRTEHGGFSSVDDLGEVPGIGPKKLESLRPQVTP